MAPKKYSYLHGKIIMKSTLPGVVQSPRQDRSRLEECSCLGSTAMGSVITLQRNNISHQERKIIFPTTFGCSAKWSKETISSFKVEKRLQSCHEDKALNNCPCCASWFVVDVYPPFFGLVDLQQNSHLFPGWFEAYPDRPDLEEFTSALSPCGVKQIVMFRKNWDLR